MVPLCGSGEYIKERFPESSTLLDELICFNANVYTHTFEDRGFPSTCPPVFCLSWSRCWPLKTFRRRTARSPTRRPLQSAFRNRNARDILKSWNVYNQFINSIIGPWWWSNGQRARLLLRRSEFKSGWSLQFFSVFFNLCLKRTKLNKKRPIYLNMKRIAKIDFRRLQMETFAWFQFGAV